MHYDILLAGFPCQAFSSVGLKRGFEDTTKGTIFFDIAKIIKDTLPNDGFKDIAILTCKTEETSILAQKAPNGLYRNKHSFTTCRKFKGLEADVVILIDVDGATFNSDNVLLYYVGTSRARIRLEIISMLTDEECIDILQNSLNYTKKIRKPKKDLSAALNALASVAT